MKKGWLSYFIYLSVLFALISLAKSNYLFIPKIQHLFFFLISILFLFTGFIACAPPWKLILFYNNYKISIFDSIISIGLPIFSKYLPGKIWSILGPPAYIAKNYEFPIKHLTSISFDTQLLTLWSGLVIGSIGLFINGTSKELGGLILFLWLSLSLVIFSDVFHRTTEKLLLKALKKPITIPKLPLRSSIKVLPYFFLNWLVWCAAFYFFAQSLTDIEIPPHAALGFALAATIGILTIIAPGGIGVREGVLVGYLVSSGLGVDEATSISIASRLWFMLGECFIFFISILLKSHHPVP